jgi:uncharacterized protein (TIGR03435 family)
MIYLAWAPDSDKLIGRPPWLTNDRMDKVKGGPDWLDNDRYDVIAKAPAGTDKDTVKVMLRSLLAQRFNVVVHPDQRPVPNYVLTAGKSIRMKQSTQTDDGGCKRLPRDVDPSVPPWMGPVVYSCRGITMEKFAAGLWQMGDDHFGAPIADNTGLNGAWDFDIAWTPRMYINGVGSNGISIAEAIDKLGLKLESRDSMVPVFVVDKANRKPTANAADIDKLLPALPDKFEVATLRPTDPNATGIRVQTLPGGRVVAQGVPLQFLIMIAWDVPPDMIADPPKFLTSDRYDLTGKAPEPFASSTAPIDIEEVRPMLRALLAERFGMQVHRETRDAPVYALVRSGSAPPKMTKSTSNDLASCVQPTNATAVAPNSRLTSVWSCHNISMELFGTRLRSMAPGYIQHYTVDATGIQGNWDFSVAWTPNGGVKPSADEPDGSMTVFDALDKELGVKLEEQKRPAPMLVIDHIEQKPTEN